MSKKAAVSTYRGRSTTQSLFAEPERILGPHQGLNADWNSMAWLMAKNYDGSETWLVHDEDASDDAGENLYSVVWRRERPSGDYQYDYIIHGVPLDEARRAMSGKAESTVDPDPMARMYDLSKKGPNMTSEENEEIKSLINRHGRPGFMASKERKMTKLESWVCRNCEFAMGNPPDQIERTQTH